MFKRFLPAILHLFIYTAFLLTQIELIEIFIDGFFGVHRFFSAYLGVLYTFIVGLIEILSALAFVATIIFLTRRNILKVARFWKAEMTAWPRLDANLILLGEIILVVAILTMNSADSVLQQLSPEHYPSTGKLPIKSSLSPRAPPAPAMSTSFRTWANLNSPCMSTARRPLVSGFPCTKSRQPSARFSKEAMPPSTAKMKTSMK